MKLISQVAVIMCNRSFMVCSRGIGKYVIDVNIIHTCERMSDGNENLYRGIQHKVSASLLKGSLNVL